MVELDDENMREVSTRFVIIEKFSKDLYFTPFFDFEGNKMERERLNYFTGYNRFFVHPGIYTKELDDSGIELISFDLVASPGFSVSLSDGYGYKKVA